MNITYPHQIDNGHGESLTFLELQQEADGDRLLLENLVAPGSGPVMHTHWLQDECITVVSGTIGYQVLGEEKKYAGAGESVLFLRGVPHRFWNAGQDDLHCTGWVKPANTLVFYLSAIYDSQKTNGSERPGTFDSAYLLTRYSKEYDLPEIPAFVKKVIMPIICQVGKLLGKYKKFADAPAPVLA